MWNNMDINGDGHIVYEEAEESLKAFFHGDAIVEARPAIKRAFDFAKDYNHDEPAHHAKKGHHVKKPHQHTQKPADIKSARSVKSSKDNSIEKGEFRIFLVSLRQRLEYFEGFNEVDISGDG